MTSSAISVKYITFYYFIEENMKGKALLATAILYTAIMLLTLVPKTLAYELKTTYTIEIHEDGTASWLIGQSAFLQTEDDKTIFEGLISRTISPHGLDQFSSNVATIINQAYNRTGRLMTAEYLTIGGNITKSDIGAYGFLKYSFDWTNFAVIENKTITMGDTFSNESFMFGNGALSIIVPTGYYVKSCLPPPDSNTDNTLKWNTINGLGNSQPAIHLSKEEANSFPPELPILLETTVTIIGVVLSSILVLKIRKRKKENKIETTPAEASGEMDDTKKILTLIKNAGGQVLQSKITEHLRCSKAKTSKILADMENKGMIERVKRGRDKVVSLRKETENAKTKLSAMQ
jgi:uncharacterized membrane protein